MITADETRVDQAIDLAHALAKASRALTDASTHKVIAAMSFGLESDEAKAAHAVWDRVWDEQAAAEEALRDALLQLRYGQ